MNDEQQHILTRILVLLEQADRELAELQQAVGKISTLLVAIGMVFGLGEASQIGLKIHQSNQLQEFQQAQQQSWPLSPSPALVPSN